MAIADDFLISWNNFTWWMSDQKYQAPEGRYFHWTNIDTRNAFVSPNKAYTTGNTFLENITCLNTYNWGIFKVLSDWKLYTDSNALVRTFSWNSVKWVWKMFMAWVEYIFYFAEWSVSWNWYIHRSTIWLWTIEDNKYSYTSSASTVYSTDDTMQIKEEWYRILFSHRNNVFSIDNDWIVEKLLELPFDENVVWITEFQWEYKIYTNAKLKNSRVYLWDWSSQFWSVSVVFNWLNIQSVINDWAYDYFTSNWWLFLLAGVQYQKLYEKKTVWSIGYSLKLIWNYDWFVYLFQSAWDLSTDKNICMYWAKPWYVKSLTPIFNIWQGNWWISAQNIYIPENIFTLWFTYYKYNWTARTTTAYVESLLFIWDSEQSRKTLERFVLRFSETSENCIIKVSFELNESWSWINIWQGKNGDLGSTNYWINVNKNMFLNPVWDFNVVRIKITFETNWLSTCKFYWIDLFGKQKIWI